RVNTFWPSRGPVAIRYVIEAPSSALIGASYSYRTEEQYLLWIKRFVLFHGKRHPAEMSAAEVSQFFTHLAVDRRVSASTQNQALLALLFLYQQVLGIELLWLEDVTRAKRPVRLPL